MPGFQANVSVSIAGTAVRIQVAGSTPGFYIAKGGTIQANWANKSQVTIGTSAVGQPSVTPSAWMFLLNPGDSVPLPDDQSVDLTSLYLNANSANDGISIGWWN